MKDKFLKDLQKIDVGNVLKLSENTNLVDSDSIEDVKIANGKNVTLVVNLAPLDIGKKEASDLQQFLVEKIEKPSSSLFRKSLKLNIIFTSSKKIKESTTAPDLSDKNTKPAQNPDIMPIPRVKKVIAIASGKGGVGKSTVAVNLALSLKRIGRNVALVDADVYGPSIPHMMNLDGKPEVVENKMIPIKSYGINCISVGSLVDKEQALIWRGPMITKTLYQLIRGVNWGYEDKDVDYLIIDLPPGTGDVHLSMCKEFPISAAVIVSTPQDVSVIDAVKAIDMFKKLDIKIAGIIQNMSYLEDESGNKSYLFGKDKAKDMAKNSKIQFLGEIPIDIKIREGGDNKNPITNSDPSSNISFCYGQIAENIVDNI